MKVNQKKVLQSLLKVVPEEQIKFAVWFGNRGGKDHDVFVVIKGNYQYGSFVEGPLDISYVGEVWVPMMVKHLDPMVTEPLMTGVIIYGQAWKYLFELSDVKVDEDVPIYLLQCAEIFYELAVQLSFEGRLREAVLTLGFVYSYALYAFSYCTCNNLVMFKDLLSCDGGRWISQNREMIKNRRLILDLDAYRVFSEVRMVLTDLRRVVGCI
jgi:hypothetical protein